MGENFFNTLHEHQEGQGREWLLALEKTGRYVFHGSPEEVPNEFVPKQAYNEGKIHGDPAISATQYADIVIFRALVNRKNFPELHGTQFGISSHKGNELSPEYLVSKETFKNLKTTHANGYVAVFDKNSFQPFSDSLWEVRSDTPQKPSHIVKVSLKDLHPGIEELPFTGFDLEERFENIHLDQEHPYGPELTVTFQKEPTVLTRRKSYGPNEEVLLDGIESDKMIALAHEADLLKSLPQDERIVKVLELLRSVLSYPFQKDIELLKESDPKIATWITERITGPLEKSQHVPLSEIFDNGYGVCSHLSVAYLWLAQQAGLQGTFAEGMPINIRRDNDELMFKRYREGELVPHMWVEIKGNGGKYIIVDPSTQIVGSTDESRTLFKKANYEGNLTNDVRITIRTDTPSSVGNGPIRGFPAGAAQCVVKIQPQLKKDAFTGKVGDVSYDGSIDVRVHVLDATVTNVRIKSVEI